MNEMIGFKPNNIYRDDKGSWLLPVSIVPVLGPALYLLLRPSLSEVPALVSSPTSEEK